MIRSKLCIVVAICLLTTLSASQMVGQNKSTPAKAKEVLAKIEKDWGDANVSQDTGTLNRILSDDIVFTTYDGKVLNKASVLESVKNEKIESDEQSDIVVRIYGNTGVVTG